MMPLAMYCYHQVHIADDTGYLVNTTTVHALAGTRRHRGYHSHVAEASA